MMKAQEEKALERAIRGYKRQYAKKHPKVVKRDAEAEKMLDEEVAEEVAEAIWATAHLNPREQADKLFDKYTFWWLVVPDAWPVSDVLNRLMLDEKEAKRLLCERFVRHHFGKNDDNADILSARVHDGKFVHFQMTRAFTGGMDAYIVLRTPKTRDAVIIRFCCN